MRKLALAACLISGCRTAAPAEPTVTAAPAHRESLTIEALAWLVGDWQAQDAAPVGERWRREQDRLVGVGYTITAGEPTQTETMEIREREGGLVYIASPVGQARTEFAIGEADAHHFVAVNPSHDFPQRIEYRLEERRIRALVSAGDRGFELLLVAQ